MISIVFFKIKRGIENFIDLFKNIFSDISCFFRKISEHSSTHRVVCHVTKARRGIVRNIKENSQNWKDRIVFGDSFEINKDDI